MTECILIAHPNPSTAQVFEWGVCESREEVEQITDPLDIPPAFHRGYVMATSLLEAEAALQFYARTVLTITEPNALVAFTVRSVWSLAELWSLGSVGRDDFMAAWSPMSEVARIVELAADEEQGEVAS